MFHFYEIAMLLPEVDNEEVIVFSTLIVKLFPVPDFSVTVVQVVWHTAVDWSRVFGFLSHVHTRHAPSCIVVLNYEKSKYSKFTRLVCPGIGPVIVI